DPREGLWMIEFSKSCLSQKSILKILKIQEIFLYNPRFFFFLFYNVYKREHVHKLNKRWPGAYFI
ncbi:hypothetical protein K8366_26025, partial [Klebsiella aerogenes]